MTEDLSLDELTLNEIVEPNPTLYKDIEHSIRDEFNLNCAKSEKDNFITIFIKNCERFWERFKNAKIHFGVRYVALIRLVGEKNSTEYQTHALENLKHEMKKDVVELHSLRWHANRTVPLEILLATVHYTFAALNVTNNSFATDWRDNAVVLLQWFGQNKNVSATVKNNKINEFVANYETSKIDFTKYNKQAKSPSYHQMKVLKRLIKAIHEDLRTWDCSDSPQEIVQRAIWSTKTVTSVGTLPANMDHDLMVESCAIASQDTSTILVSSAGGVIRTVSPVPVDGLNSDGVNVAAASVAIVDTEEKTTPTSVIIINNESDDSLTCAVSPRNSVTIITGDESCAIANQDTSTILVSSGGGVIRTVSPVLADGLISDGVNAAASVAIVETEETTTPTSVIMINNEKDDSLTCAVSPLNSVTIATRGNVDSAMISDTVSVSSTHCQSSNAGRKTRKVNATVTIHSGGKVNKVVKQSRWRTPSHDSVTNISHHQPKSHPKRQRDESHAS
jgi:hypothetical protein